MERQLSRLLGWLLDADKANVETILICNGCTDRTFEVLSDFVSDHNLNYSIVVNSEVKGPGQARNLGIKMARGKYILFWDADDYGLVSIAVEILSEELDDSKLIVCNYKHIQKNSSIISSQWGKSRTENLFKFAINPGIWRVIFNRQTVENCQFGDSLMGEDQVFLSQVLTINPSINFVDKVIYEYYSDAPNQLTANRANLAHIPESLEQMLKTLKSKPDITAKLLSIMFLRQIATLLMRGSLRLKVKATSLLLRFIFIGAKDQNIGKKLFEQVKLIIMIITRVVK